MSSDGMLAWVRAEMDAVEKAAREAAKHAAAGLATADRKDERWLPPYDGSAWSQDYDHVFVVEQRPGRKRHVMIADCGFSAFMLTPHIARHDPAAVLRRIAADRKIIDGYEHWERRFESGEELSDYERGSLDGLYAAARTIAEGYGWTATT